MNKSFKLPVLSVIAVVSLLILYLLFGTKAFIGERVKVEPTELGMVLTSDGFEGDIIGPSRFRLETCWFVCPELIKVDASDNRYPESVRVYMAEDDVFITVPVNLVLRLDRSRVSIIFGNVPHRNGVVTLMDIYERYAVEIIISTIRGVISSYSVEYLLSNQESITVSLLEQLDEELKDSPFSLINGGVREISLPNEITEALQNTAERRIQVRQEAEQLQVDLARLDRELEEARKQRQVDIERANAEKEIQEIIAAGFSDEYERYRMLEVMLKMAESDNKVFIPVDMLGSISSEVMVGKE